MPLRGESIGTAYVRVLADASGFPDSLREEIARDEPGIKRQGRHYAQAFEEGFNDEVERSDDLNLRTVLNRALGSNEATQEFFKGKEWDRFKSRMRSEFGDVGALAAHELEEKFVNSGTLRGLDNEVENIVKRITATTQRITRTTKAEADAAAKAMTDFERDFRRAMDDADQTSRRVAGDNINNLERVRRTFENIGSTVRKLHVEFDRSGQDAVKFIKGLKTADRDSATIFGRLGKVVDGIGEKVGRMFGKGNRNNFLNFTGSTIGNLTKVTALPLKLLDNLGQLVNGFKVAQDAGAGFIDSMKAGFTEMAKDAEGGSTALSTSFVTLLASIPAVTAALLVLFGVLGLVASLISGLAAAVIALAGSLAFGLVGAIAPLVGALGPLAAGAGVVIATFTTLNKKSSKELTSTIKTLKKEVGGLGDQFVHAFGNSFHDNIDEAIFRLDKLKPLFRITGQAAGQIATNITKSLQSHAFDRFLIYLQRQVPFAIKSMSKALGNVFSAVGTILIDLVPQTRDFFGWLDKITRQFKNFVQQNPKEIKQFFRDAAQSTKDIGHFLGQAVGLVGDLFAKGKGTGDSIFTSLGDSIGQFRDFLDKHPDGVAEFFKNGKQTADNIGGLALAITRILDALDSPQSRKNLNAFFDVLNGIGKLAKPIAFISQSAGDAISPLFTLVKLLGALGRIKIHFPDIGGAIKNFFKGFNSGGGGGIGVLSIKPPSIAWIGPITRKIGNFFSGITSLANRVSFSPLGAAAARAAGVVVARLSAIPGKLRSLVGEITGAVAQWRANILSELSDIPQTIVDFFHGLGSRIASAIGGIGLHFDFPSPPSWLSKLDPSALVNKLTASGGVFDGAQFRIIGEKGPEAVVPLTGPLSNVDPAVRWLAELARGHGSPTALPAGKSISNEWHITTTTPDVVGVANELLDRMVATGY